MKTSDMPELLRRLLNRDLSELLDFTQDPEFVYRDIDPETGQVRPATRPSRDEEENDRHERLEDTEAGAEREDGSPADAEVPQRASGSAPEALPGFPQRQSPEEETDGWRHKRSRPATPELAEAAGPADELEPEPAAEPQEILGRAIAARSPAGEIERIPAREAARRVFGREATLHGTAAGVIRSLFTR